MQEIYGTDSEAPTPPYLSPVEDLTDTEMLREILTTMRNVETALAQLADSPMVSAIMSGGNPLLAMMNRG
jgi:hypothetical protein